MSTINTVVDQISDCAFVAAFLSAAIGTFSQRKEITLSYDASVGLSLILDDISQRLVASGDALVSSRTTQEVQP